LNQFIFYDVCTLRKVAALSLLEFGEFLPEHASFPGKILRLELCAIHENPGKTCGLCKGAESTLEVSGTFARLSKGDLTLSGVNKRNRRHATTSALHLLFCLFLYLCDGHGIQGIRGLVV